MREKERGNGEGERGYQMVVLGEDGGTRGERIRGGSGLGIVGERAGWEVRDSEVAPDSWGRGGPHVSDGQGE